MSIWELEYDGFDPVHEGHREALCTLGNGYFATRGAAPENDADGVHYPGTYLGGYYDRLESDVGGRRIEDESLVNAPNWLPLTFRTEGEPWFDLRRFELLEYGQSLDLFRGVLKRRIRLRDAHGRTTAVTQRRIVHMRHQHLAALETTLTAEDWSGPLEVLSALDGRVENRGVPRYRSLASRHLVPAGEGESEPSTVWLEVETARSHLRIAEACRTRVLRDGTALEPPRELKREPGYVGHGLRLDLQRGRPVTVEKVVCVFGSRDDAISEPAEEALRTLERIGDFDELLRSHVLEWDLLWERFRLELGCCSEHEEMALNLHVFHALQTVSGNTIGADVGVPARGLHGEAYRGHVFWDELFIFPFLNLRLPGLTRALLMYRFRRLPEARWAAAEAGLAGAMFPWQSGSDGREESQFVHLNPRSGRWLPDNTWLQRHIGAAVAFNAWQYYEVTRDVEFLSYYGAELILEIARFWASIARYDHVEDRYWICGVMGPDEYHDAYPWRDEPGIDNNAYTNVMAAWALAKAIDVMSMLPAHRSRPLAERLSLTREELETWDRISRRMKVAFLEGRIISQFEGYDRLEEFDWDGYRGRYGDIQRLDRILEAEGDSVNRYKASKQADVLMLFYLFSAEQLEALFLRLGYPFDPASIPANIDYYLHRTSHGSTLSSVVHSWVLARSDREASWSFFSRALQSDIADIQGGTTAEGVHLGAMAGTIDLVQRGWTGMEIREGELWLSPALPEEVERLAFSIRYRGQPLDFEITHDEMRVSTRSTAREGIRLGIQGGIREMEPGATMTVPLRSATQVRH